MKLLTHSYRNLIERLVVMIVAGASIALLHSNALAGGGSIHADHGKNILALELQPDPEVSALTFQYKIDKLRGLIELNEIYIEKIARRLKQAMAEEDLPAANQADREMKRLIGEKASMERELECAELIASLAGKWKLLTSGWEFEISADGSVTAPKTEDTRGRIQVINLEERVVRMTGFPMAMTWVVEEDSNSLAGDRHPAGRIKQDKVPTRE